MPKDSVICAALYLQGTTIERTRASLRSAAAGRLRPEYLERLRLCN